MSKTADGAAPPSTAARMGLRRGQTVQEFGYDDDVDHALRDEIEAVTGSEMLDVDADDVVDAVVLWWRDEDGDLTDAVVDVLSALDDQGQLWVLVPKAGADGHIEASDIDDAASTAGLHVTSTLSVGQGWTACRLVAPKGQRKE